MEREISSRIVHANETSAEVTISSNVDREIIPKKKKISLFWIALAFIFLFCFMSIIFWYVNVKSSFTPLNVYILTQFNDSHSDGSRTSSKKQSTTEQTVSTTARDQCIGTSQLEKLDCYPDAISTEEQCIQRGCCFQSVSGRFSRKDSLHLPPVGIPNCFYPTDYVGYLVSTVTHTYDGLTAVLERTSSSGFLNDIKKLRLVVSNIDSTTLRIKITDYSNKRYEAPLHNNISQKEIPDDARLYDVNLSSDGILSVVRRSSGIKIFNTDLSYLVYSDQFLQLSSKLPSHYVYGLGEHYTSMLKSTNWTRWTFFNKDNFPGPGLNIYGTHPFYIAFENENKFHGIFLLNSNSMDVVLQPTPAITYRTIGGVLDYFIFLGPSPSEVVQQYIHVVGDPAMPPYWSLGFHLCKYGYNSVEETRKVYQRTRDAGVPYDVQWNDIDYMERKNDFTYDKNNFAGLPDFANELHVEGMRYVVMFDPGVSNTETPGSYPPYDDGLKSDIFIKSSTGGIFVGKVWNPNTTVFPDFSHPEAASYWTRQFKLFHDVIDFDGAWIDMNEISNFYYNGTVVGCPKDSTYESPQYLPGGLVPLNTQTLCMTAKHHDTLHYNEHNVYGYREAIATNIALKNITEKRPFIISRATFSGQGHFSGHWSGDIASTWEDMRYSVINMINFNMYGIPLVGSDICGFRLSTTVELCARWYALGAFYPFARNHNDINRVEQDPAALGVDVLKSAKTNLLIRYSLLPYLYTLFYRSSVFGETVVRPLFFEFPDDVNTYSIDEQFLWGASLMVMPALYEGMTEVVAYFPNETWFDFHTGEKRVSTGEKYTLPAPLDKINIAVRSGSILVMQYPETNTNKSRLNDFILYVTLGEAKEADGQLFWDDGESIDTYENNEYNLIEFKFRDNELRSHVINQGYNVTMTLGLIRISGCEMNPSNVSVNNDVNVTVSWEDNHKVVRINTSVSLLEPLDVQYQCI